MNPLLSFPKTQETLRFRRPTNCGLNGFPPSGLPAPAIRGLRTWLASERSSPNGLYLGFAADTPGGTRLRMSQLVDQAEQSNSITVSSQQHRYDGNPSPNLTMPWIPMIFHESGNGVGFLPGSGQNTTNGQLFTNRRAFSFFMIGEQILNRPGEGNDTYAQWGNGTLGRCEVESVSRKLQHNVTSNVLTSTTLPPVYSNRAFYGWVGDEKEFRFHINDQMETLGPATAGEVGLAQFPHDATQQYAWTDFLIFNRAVTPDEVFRVLLPYARSRGVTTEYDSTIIFDGDSITYGFKTSTGRGFVRRLGLDPRVRFVNLGKLAITMATLDSDFALKPQLFIPTTGKTKCVINLFAGTNDIALNGATGAATYTSLTSYVSKAHALSPSVPVIVFTALPRTDNTAGENTELADYNSRIVGNAAGADYVIDLSTESRLTDASNTTYFYTDGIHLTDLGEQILADLVRPTIKAAIAAL